MPPSIVNTREQVLQNLSSDALAQATVAGRMSGELALRRSPQRLVETNLTNNWASLLHDTQPDLGEPPAQAPQAPPLPAQLGPFNSGGITFNNGVPVGGWMSLAIFQDGGYSFSGHFHDSGAPSYDVDCVWVVVSESGKAFTFGIKGVMHGTFDAGSRNFDFAQNGKNDAVRDAWPELCAGYHWRWNAYVNWNVAAAVDDAVNALKSAGTVISAVVAVVALL